MCEQQTNLILMYLQKQSGFESRRIMTTSHEEYPKTKRSTGSVHFTLEIFEKIHYNLESYKPGFQKTHHMIEVQSTDTCAVYKNMWDQ